MKRILNYTLLFALALPLVGCNAPKGAEDVHQEEVVDTSCSRTASVEWNLQASTYEYVIAGNQCNNLTKVITDQADDSIQQVTYSFAEEFAIVNFTADQYSALVKEYGATTAQIAYTFDVGNNYIEVTTTESDGGVSYNSITEGNPKYASLFDMLSPEKALEQWNLVQAESTVFKNF